MPLFLSNADQAQCITPAEAMEALTEGLRQFARGDAVRRPRIDAMVPTNRPDEFFIFSSMEGGIRRPGYYALRIKPDIYAFREVEGSRRMVSYARTPGLYGGLVFLYSVQNAELLAIMNDGVIQHLRVAATAGLGIRFLSRPDARVMGIVGSGGMARVFPLTARVSRRIERLQVWSPNRRHLEEYCAEMAGRLDCEIVPCDSAAAVAADADILCACTTSLEPVLRPEWIRPGMHLNNVTPWELSDEVRAKIEVAGVLVRRRPLSVTGFVDEDFIGVGLGAMTYACGQPEERARVPLTIPNRYPNARIVDCYDWRTDTPYRRARPDEITILANNSYGTVEGDAGVSNGIQGIQFSSVAGRVYERAREKKLGTELPTEMFYQDIPT